MFKFRYAYWILFVDPSRRTTEDETQPWYCPQSNMPTVWAPNFTNYLKSSAFRLSWPNFDTTAENAETYNSQIDRSWEGVMEATYDLPTSETITWLFYPFTQSRDSSLIKKEAEKAKGMNCVTTERNNFLSLISRILSVWRVNNGSGWLTPNVSGPSVQSCDSFCALKLNDWSILSF